MAPIIGITFSSKIITGTSKNYIHAIEEFGGEPRILYPGVPDSEFADIDGLLLTGGGDIHPDYFDQDWHPSLKYVNEARDALEIPLCREVIEANLPVFGICRGIQVMSVAMRGSLYQDVPSQLTEPLTHPAESFTIDSYHEIEIEPNNRLREIIGRNSDEVNSAHHQAVDEVGKGFIVTARSVDGVIEGIENPSKDFVLGVQYHPERMIRTEAFREHRRKLFEAFIQAASG
ncbi:MAG: gamma-glutamyl-gamma-aminobutyrate hydrolase family protein [Candidatus Poribacteria bacterium]|nr:gamma-glutamyl-gamma-aminobutyrate hydrolase family protein [Candidatus Poribacteria bacterium]